MPNNLCTIALGFKTHGYHSVLYTYNMEPNISGHFVKFPPNFNETRRHAPYHIIRSRTTGSS